MKRGTKLGLLALVLAVSGVRFWFYQAEQVALPENRTLFVLAWLTAAALGAAAIALPGRSVIGSIAALPAIFFGLLLPFTVAISEQTVGTDAIQVGDTIPAFTAPTDRGEIFDSASLRGKPVLMKFFRAHW